MSKIMEPEKNKNLEKWKSRLESSRLSYSNDLKKMVENESLYNGDRSVMGNPNKSQKVTKVSSNVRNITYELIECQIDSSIPMPKVIPIHEEDKELAKSIEHVLANEVRLLKMNNINDLQERVCPVQGGDFFHIEWDARKGYHCNLGGVVINRRHPRQVIPQAGCTDIEEMDYIFVQISQTKDFVKRKYGVDVEEAGEERPEIRNNPDVSHANDIVTVNISYYINESGGVGKFVWCDDYVLEDIEDYQARRLERCVKCGAVRTGDVCACGSKKFKYVNEDFEELEHDLILSDGKIIKAYETIQNYEKDEQGNPVVDFLGNPVVNTETKKTKIPYYKPNVIPLVLRKNVSKDGKMLGISDADVIKDQQDIVKKLGGKINEKILKGGSIVTLPTNAKVETNDSELKVVRVKDAHEKSLIGPVTLQADPTIDRLVMNDNYEAARSTLGINDSFQGKYDPSATSGTAKQFAINQAAGRMESKRVMKNDAYARLYEMIFKFMLAYSDQKVPYSYQDKDGEYIFDHFDRYQFLRQDAAGEFYWDDEFIFETDPTSTIMMNREALWQQADLKLQSGAFGALQDPKTLYRYWSYLEKNNYPNAGEMKKQFEQEVQEQELMKQTVMGGGMNEMS